MNCKKIYLDISHDCCITTASCDKFFLRVINLIYSIKKNFINHPNIYVYNLGMSKFQISELKNIKGVRVRDIPAFAPHWRYDYSWKLFVYNDDRPEKIFFHIDAGSIVLRALNLIFLSIFKNNTFLIGQHQILTDISPREYFDMLDLSVDEFGENGIFTAGVIGFNTNNANIKKLLNTAFFLSKEGYCLGYSKIEIHRDTNGLGIIRACPRFRHDQTIINLLIMKYFRKSYIHDEKKYIGLGNGVDHPKQFIWNSRLDSRALKYILCFNVGTISSFIVNRITFLSGMYMRKLNKWLQKS